MGKCACSQRPDNWCFDGVKMMLETNVALKEYTLEIEKVNEQVIEMLLLAKCIRIELSCCEKQMWCRKYC